MKEYPILFKSPMVQAIVDGRKTVTRRVMDPQPPKNEDHIGSSFSLDRAVANTVKAYSLNDYDRLAKHATDWELLGSVGVARDAGYPMRYRCPYGGPGDRLYVRETWRTDELADGVDGVRFRADDAFVPIADTPAAADAWVKAHNNGSHGEKWRPSIFLPRWASRILLEVVSVRVERLREITDEDAVKEGATVRPGVRRHNRDGWSMDWSEVGKLNRFGSGDRVGQRRRLTEDDLSLESPKYAFASLWEGINGKRPGCAWEQNPWVWRVEFRRLP